MADLNMNLVSLRDNRYDAVLHLVTAADGAEAFYGTDNVARYEDTSQAIEKDKRLREAYMGHRKWFMIDNSFNDFDSKMKYCISRVHQILGRQGGTAFYKKYLLTKSTQRTMALTAVPINLPEGQHYEESEVTETFINFKTSEGKVIEASVEKKGHDQAFAYTLKVALEKRKTIINKRKKISAAEYIELKQDRLPGVEDL